MGCLRDCGLDLSTGPVPGPELLSGLECIVIFPLKLAMGSPVTNCRYFNGYKPCGKNADCNSKCPSKEIPQLSILIVHLGAMGAVARSTSLLAPIKRKYPSSKITWITEAPSNQLLMNHPLIDHVYTSAPSDLLAAAASDYEIAFVIDKSRVASGIARQLQIDELYGFISNETGGIVPANSEAMELWEIGLSDQKKFFENKKAETQLVTEAMALHWMRDEYDLRLSSIEWSEVERLRHRWKSEHDQPLIGINTGCGPLMPAKKWTVEYQRQLISKLMAAGYKNLVLLGGPDDTERNLKIGEGLAVVQSPTSLGLRNGLQSVAACDLVVTGDSLGMHMAIAMKKYVVAWFGPSCAHEIDLYGRGEKLITESACSPCWKKDCQKSVMCYDQVSLERVVESIAKGVQICRSRSYSFRQPSSEISF